VSPPAPTVVADRAADAADAIAERARADVALIRERIARIKQDFYEIGLALSRLKQPAAFGALGYKSFHACCKGQVGISGAKADELVAISTSMSADLARGLGQKNAMALLTLCRATPEDDRPADLASANLTLPSGEVLDVGGSSVRDKLSAAKEIRDDATSKSASGAGKKSRGRTTTAEERRVAAEAEAALHAAGLRDASVRAQATKPGRPAVLRLEGIPTTELATLCNALCRARRK